MLKKEYENFNPNYCKIDDQVKQMADYEAVTALLMLSANYQLLKTTPTPPTPPADEPEDLSMKTTTYNPNRRLLSPNVMEQTRRRYMTHQPLTPTMIPHFDDTRTSSPIAGMKSVVQLHSDFTKIKHETTDHQYSMTPRPQTTYTTTNHHHQHQHHQQLVVKPNESPTDSGHSSSFHEDVHHQLPTPVLSIVFNKNNTPVELPYQVLVEFDKIERESNHRKDDYIKEKLDENPVDYEYNPSKSRLRKTYEDPEMEAGRAKNNLASRKSRYKKKLASRLLSINYDYDVLENRSLYDQERWMMGVVAELENLVQQNGVEVDVLKDLRHFCGLK